MRSRIEIWTLTALLALTAGDALADTYAVRVTNLTKLQTFTPLLVVSSLMCCSTVPRSL